MQAPAGLSEAQVDAPRVLMCEVWVVDDAIDDWRSVICLAPAGEVEQVVWDRRTPVLSGMDPFIQLTLDDAADYTWGFSETDDLSALQDWREHRMDQIDQLMELQLDPPLALSGFGGNVDERAKRLRKPGGVIATPIPTARAERLAPVMPPEAFGEIEAIDRMFADQGGLPVLYSGQSEGGIRAGNQIGILATVASARLRDNAMRVEYAASECATVLWRLKRDLDADPLVTSAGKRFLLRQVPRDIVVGVDSHSASPLYAQAIKAEADNMLQAGAIDLPDYIRMKDPPRVDILVEKGRKIAAARAEQAERLMAVRELAARMGKSPRLR